MRIKILLINFSKNNLSKIKIYLPKNLYLVKNIKHFNESILENYAPNLIFLDWTGNNYENSDLDKFFGSKNQDFLRQTAIFIYGNIDLIKKNDFQYLDDVISEDSDLNLIRAKILSMVRYYLRVRELKLYHEFNSMDFDFINKTNDCRILFISDSHKIPNEISTQIYDKILSIDYSFFNKHNENFLIDYPYDFDLIIINGVDNIHHLISIYSQIKSHLDLRDAHILYVNKHTNFIFLADVINLGIQNFINHPFNNKDLLFQISTQLRNKKYLSMMLDNIGLNANSSWYDELTSVYNRKYLNYFLNKIELSEKNNPSHAIMMIVDVDNFKEINDLYGHQVGDNVLKEVASILKTVIKKPIVIRFGGDEFLIILLNQYTSRDKNNFFEDKTNYYIKKINNAIEKSFFSDQKLKVKLSIGCAMPRNNESLSEIFNNADKEMYKAKFLKKYQYGE
jgi:diguanylate cyclase (GGDEF)-like protein